jgi:AmmeMemoRadiSam system protein A
LTTIAPTERNELFALARASIELGLEDGRLGAAPPVHSDSLNVQRATFVTLRAREDLRGCCGSIEPRFPLAQDVWRNAWASAFTDPRFPPLTAAEYPQIDLHISVLSPLERLAVASEAELLSALMPDRDGLLLQLGAARATFLPAVWESLPEPVEFVRQLKLKAGWRPDFWSPQIDVWRYRTESFGERECSK